MSDKTNEFEAGALAGVVILPIIMLLFVPVMLWQGWAAAILWGWFISPTFGVPAISISQAAGIMLVVGLLRFKISGPKDDITWPTKIVAFVIGPPSAVCLGWIVKWTAL